MKEIDDLVDIVETVSARMERVGHAIEEKKGTSETLELNKQTLEKDRAKLRNTKLAIANLAITLCGCSAKKPGQTFRQAPKECQKLMGQIDANVDKVVGVSSRMERVGNAIDDKKGTSETLELNRQTLEKDTATLRTTKLAIANLAVELCVCCGKTTNTSDTPPTKESLTAIDQCLVGAWRSEVFTSDNGGGAKPILYRGAAISILPNGTIEASYDGSIVDPSPQSIDAIWAGRATGLLEMPKSGFLTVISTTLTDVVQTTRLRGEELTRNPQTDLGPISPPNHPRLTPYTCDATTWTFQPASTGKTVVFKRAGTMPR